LSWGIELGPGRAGPGRVGPGKGPDLEEEGVLGREDAAGPDQADPGHGLAREEVLPWARAG
jgi:hypothetical protein